MREPSFIYFKEILQGTDGCGHTKGVFKVRTIEGHYIIHQYISQLQSGIKKGQSEKPIEGMVCKVSARACIGVGRVLGLQILGALPHIIIHSGAVYDEQPMTRSRH